MAGLTSRQRWQIRRIFLQRRDEYSPTEAAKVLGVPRAEIIEGIEAGEIDASKVERVEYRLRWRTVAALAITKWREEDIYDALGPQADRVLPALMRVETLTVSIPAYALRMLEWQAAQRGVSVDEQLRPLLHDIANAQLLESPEIDTAIPGFREAVLFPDA